MIELPVGIGAGLFNATADKPLRIVAKGGIVPQAPGTADGYLKSLRRSRLLVGGQGVETIRLVFANLYLTAGENANANPLTVRAGLEKITGGAQTVAVTFNGGAPSVTLAGGAWAVSDPVSATAFGLSEFPAGWDARVRTEGSVSTTGHAWPRVSYCNFETVSGQYSAYFSGADEQVHASGALTTPSGGKTDSVTNIAAYGPACIIGTWKGAPDISVMLDGDSIVTGHQDATETSATGGGFLVRGLRSVNGRTVPHVKASVSGERASHWAEATSAFRRHLMGYCTHIIDDSGVNDLRSGRTVAQVLADKQRKWTDFKTYGAGAKFIVDTPIVPHTTGTYATEAAQTPVANFGIGERSDQLNAAVAALAGLANGPNQIIDTRTPLQGSESTAKWKPNFTSDGLHPAAAGHAAMATPVTTAALGWIV